MLLAAFVGMAATFRWSYAPFLALGMAVSLWPARSKLKFADFAGAVLVLLLVMLPSFAYNSVRTGSPFVAAAAAPQFPNMPRFSTDIFRGIFDLTLSGSKGLFIFCPCILFSIFGFLRRFRPPGGIWCGISVSSLLYLVTLSAIPARGGGLSWGPRYLIPALPLLFYLTAMVGSVTAGFSKKILMILLFVSALINVPTFAVNYMLALSEDPLAVNNVGFHPEAAIYRGLITGLRGKILPVRNELEGAKSNVTRDFPDIWLAHAARQFKPLAPVAVLACLFLFGIMAYGVHRACQDDSPGQSNFRKIA